MAQQLFEEINFNGHIEFQVQLELTDAGEIAQAQVYAIGGHEFLEQVQAFKQTLVGPLEGLAVPEGEALPAMVLREMILRLKGQWQPPYDELNICHCRAVPTATVDQAIIYGAHTAEKVSKMTSASTACGTCRSDVLSMIQFRKGIKAG